MTIKYVERQMSKFKDDILHKVEMTDSTREIIVASLDGFIKYLKIEEKK